MGNPYHRPKHLQVRNWFRITLKGEAHLVRPVNGEDWYNEPGLSHGVVHLVDENAECVGVVEIGYFDKHAVRVSDIDD